MRHSRREEGRNRSRGRGRVVDPFWKDVLVGFAGGMVGSFAVIGVAATAWHLHNWGFF